MKRLTTLGVVLGVLALASTASAQADKELVPDEVENKGEGKEAGWYPKLVLGATVSFAHSDHVIGQQNGQTWTIGPQLSFNYDYYGGPHEFRNGIGIHEVFSRTPLIDEFVKTTDSLAIESVYLYHVGGLPWFGPFVRATLDTSIFPTKDVQPKDVRYIRKGTGVGTPGAADHVPAEVLAEGDRYDLTKAFAPLKLTQSLGAFATPLATESIKLEFRVGVGAREVFVQDGEALSDSEDTGDDADGFAQLDVIELQDYAQLGGEIWLGAAGTIIFDDLGKERPLLYGLSAEFLMPFYTDVDTELDGLDLTTIKIEASLGIKLFSWMSLDYALKVVREPVLLDEFQVSNNLLLNFSYALVE